MKQSVRCVLTLVLCSVLSLSGVLVGIPAARAADTGTWTQLPLAQGHVLSLAIDPLTPATLYAGTEGAGVFRSTDRGTSWTAVNTGIPENYRVVQCLAIDPLTPTTLYVGTRSVGVFRSTDSGATWTAVNTGLPNEPLTSFAVEIASLTIDPVTPTTLYACTAGGIFRSVDSGDGWTPLSPGAGFFGINPTTLSILYARTQTSVMRSTDSGTTWTTASTGLTGLLNWSITSLAINPLTPSTLYASTSINAAPPYGGGGVFRSTDSGVTWTAVNAGLTTINGVECLAINPRTPTTLYAGTNGSGVFCSTDSGVAWTPINTGLTNPNVSSLAIDPLSPTILYALTSAENVFRYDTAHPAFVLTPSAGTGGTITPNTPQTVSKGDSYTFTITPDAGYHVSSVVVNGTSVGTMTSYTFTNLAADHTIAVSFAAGAKRVIELKIGSGTMYVDGVAVSLQAPPIILNSRTFLPIRAIGEAIGAFVSWDAPTQKVTVTRGGNVLEFMIDWPQAKLNGWAKKIDPHDMDVVPVIMNGRTLLPLRFVAEALGLDVAWDPTTKKITIVCSP